MHRWWFWNAIVDCLCNWRVKCFDNWLHCARLQSMCVHTTCKVTSIQFSGTTYSSFWCHVMIHFVQVWDISRWTPTNEIPLVFNTTYSLYINGSHLRDAITKHWDVIADNEIWNQLYPKRPIIAQKRNINLKDK